MGFHRLVCIGSIFIAVLGCRPQEALETTAADVVFTDGRIYTLDVEQPWAEAVAVSSDRISFVGPADEVGAHIGPQTTVVDLRGRMMLPAFQDSHVHPILAGVAQFECDLESETDLAGYRSRISSFAAAHPDAAWIVGRGWSMSVFGPGGRASRKMLDELVPDRPVYLESIDGHTAWVNSKALELAGINRDTPDPVGGVIDRVPGSGEPVGSLQERAKLLVETHVPPVPEERRLEGLRSAIRKLLSVGIVSIQDAKVDRPYLETYASLDRTGELRLRVVAALLWDDSQEANQIDELLALRAEYSNLELVRPITAKIFLDGVMENYMAAMLEPYRVPSATRGHLRVETDRLNRVVTRLDAEGFQVHFHAIGDAAVRQALDAIEQALEVNGQRGNRHVIAHLQIIDPRDLGRFSELEVAASFQPLWAYAEEYVTELTIPFIGLERARWMYPIGSVHEAGGLLAFGSDWPVSTPNPFVQIETAITRQSPSGEPTEPLFPAERIDLETALAAFTINGAFVNHQEDQTGSIEVGKLADLIVIDRNLFEIAPEEISETSVLVTLLGGQVVHGDLAPW
ncbi:MAG: amidohydrolase family protein [Acidobacteriota bacterium]